MALSFVSSHLCSKDPYASAHTHTSTSIATATSTATPRAPVSTPASTSTRQPFSSSSSASSSSANPSLQSTAPPSPSQLEAILAEYAAGLLPKTSRVDPATKQREGVRIGVGEIVKVAAFVGTKVTQAAANLVSHHVWGPRKKSWGVEMSLITGFMRNMGGYSSLTDVATLRAILAIGGVLPTAADAIITPVSFRVKRRRLRGFLAQLDAAEDGRRELTGEWVVHHALWRRMHKARGAGGAATKEGAPAEGEGDGRKVVLYLHGGAYYMFSAATHRVLTIQTSKYTDTRVLALNYRLAPETRFPGPLHDAVSAYLRLVEDLGVAPSDILLAGDSAGGGLCLALMLYLRDEGYPLPAGGILMSPWVDLTMSCDSWETNEPYDILPMPKSDDHLNPVLCYLGATGVREYLTHPYVSPLFGDLSGLPPLLVQAGEAEVLRDEITLLAHKATRARVDVVHEVFQDAVHVFQTFTFLEASRQAFQSMRWFARALEQAQSDDGAGASAGTDAGAGETDAEAATAEGPDADADAGLLSPPRTPQRSFSPPVSLPPSKPGLRRSKSLLSPFSPLEPPPPTAATAASPTASQRRSTTAVPRIRARSNSHPDICTLVADYSEQGPAMESRVYRDQ